jgi:hypothetical protein
MIFQKKKEKDIIFADTSRFAYQMKPIMMAKDVPSHFQKSQIDEYGKFMFPNCPGTMDYKKQGYIIPAWDDINIIADKDGSLVFLGGSDKRHSAFAKPRKMGIEPMKGIFNPQGDIKFDIWHVGAPWSVHVSKDVSALVLPAFYHSNFLDDLYVYPGIVDYSEKFTVINFIFSPKRACKMIIKAGTPLLHVIPFKPDNITAGYGPADDYQIDRSNSLFSSATQFYRKYIMHEKSNTLEIK